LSLYFEAEVESRLPLRIIFNLNFNNNIYDYIKGYVPAAER